MKPLSHYLLKASKQHWAVPHFNVASLVQLKAVSSAAAGLRTPLMIGASESEREFMGLPHIVALVRIFREELGAPLFLNADHTKSVRAAKAAIDAGFDSVHIDLSKKSWKENTAGTREVVRYAKRKNKNINVEGELGYLVTESSKLYKKKITVDKGTFTKPTEAIRFVKDTGVHRFAAAVGNLHGIAANKPRLDFKLIAEIRRRLPSDVALVLHGGSGNSPAVFKKVIELGFNNIHISTEYRLAYRKALEESLKKNKDELAPYRIFDPVVMAVQKAAEKYIKLFGAAGRA